MLNWVEQQHRKLINDNVNAKRENDLKRSKKVSLKAYSSSRVIKTFIIDYVTKKRVCSQKRLKAKSILDLIDLNKIIKTSKQKKKYRWKTSILRDISRATKKTNVDFKIVEFKNNATISIKNKMCARFRFVHFLRIFKFVFKKSIK